MAENKFIEKLKGKQSAKSLIEIEKAGSVASFGSMPIGSSDAQRVYADARDNAVVIANSAINWKIQNSSLVITDVTGDGQDYSGNVPVSGISDQQGNNLWLNAQYTVPADGMLFTANTKWVLKLCGDNLINSNGSTIDFTVVLKLGVANIITKTFTVAEQANFFNKELVIDFEETNSSAIKLSQGDTITLQLLSGTATASARIYTGMTVLSCLQRKITGDLVDIKGSSVEDLEADLANHIADKNNPHEVTKAQVGLGNCNNTSDLDKPISTATQTALNGKVNIDGSSIMTGPLKIRAGSMQCAIAPYWDGVGFFKLNSDNSVTLLASMEATDGLCPAANNTYNLGKTNYKWKDLYVSRVITGVLNNGADINVPTKGGTLARLEDIYDRMTNCVSRIPQDISVEFSGATFTIKSGSKVYYPNGTDTFDSYTTDTDHSYSYTGNATYYVFLSPNHGIEIREKAHVFASDTEPTVSGYAMWYDTANNLMKRTTDSGATWTSGYSLPFAVYTVQNNVIANIDYTFNGFGFVDSKVFVLPGVEVLAPNGRNSTGTIKTTTITVSAISVVNSYNDTYIINSQGLLVPVYYANYTEQEETPSFVNGLWYKPSDNIMYSIDSGTITKVVNATVLRIRTAASGVQPVESMSRKLPFRAVDYSDTEFIGHQATPSSVTKDITLGSSGNTYTAPADGYFTIVKSAAASGEYLTLRNSTNGLNIGVYPPSGMNGRAYIPVAKGDVITINYTLTGATSEFKFVYANGAK